MDLVFGFIIVIIIVTTISSLIIYLTRKNLHSVEGLVEISKGLSKDQPNLEKFHKDRLAALKHTYKKICTVCQQDFGQGVCSEWCLTGFQIAPKCAIEQYYICDECLLIQKMERDIARRTKLKLHTEKFKQAKIYFKKYGELDE